MGDLIYLACPYTHDDPYIKACRAYVAVKVGAALTNLGYHIWNPIGESERYAEEVIEPVKGNWEYWKEHDLMQLDNCTELLVIPLMGWQESVGVQAEIAYAKENNIPIRYISLRSLLDTNSLCTYANPPYVTPSLTQDCITTEEQDYIKQTIKNRNKLRGINMSTFDPFDKVKLDNDLSDSYQDYAQVEDLSRGHELFTKEQLIFEGILPPEKKYVQNFHPKDNIDPIQERAAKLLTKPPIGQLHPFFLESLATVLQLSLEKGYVLDNWMHDSFKNPVIADRLNSAMRHINAFKKGIDVNEEETMPDKVTSCQTKPYHLCQAAYNLLMIATLLYHYDRTDLDDRYPTNKK